MLLNLLRIPYELWADAAKYRELLRLLKAYPCGIGAVSLFTASVHPPLPLGELKRRCDIMEQRMDEAREARLCAGINILATIGHHNEDLDNCFSGEYARMTNAQGETCRGSFCMNDAAYLADYVLPAYRILAEARPDHIWIDDDVRYGHMPIGNGCYCDKCIAAFNRETGGDWTRQALREALNGGDIALRKAWLRSKSAAIENLFRNIGRTVRKIDDTIALGWMTGERYAEGYDFAACADALSDGGKYDILWRPGGGAYTDYCFDDIVAKSQEIGRQAAYLPQYVTAIQSEIENFPYQLLKKSPVSTAAEAALTMMVGCTGAAFNILPSESGEPLSVIEPHLAAIDNAAQFYALLHEKLRGLRPVGIHTGWRKDSMAAAQGAEWSQTSGGQFASYARELLDFGLPECYNIENAQVTVLHGHSVDVYSDDELLSLLRGALYVDATALDLINRRGFSEYTGFAKGAAVPVDAREQYADVPLNAGFALGIRNCRQAFNRGDSYALLPQADGAEILSRLIDYHENITADCAMGYYENALGGRIAVGGYYPFTWVSDTFKTRQMKRLFVRLSDGTLPAYAESYARVRNHVFCRNGRVLCALFNPGNATITDLRIAVRSESESCTVTCMNGEMYSAKTELCTEQRGYRVAVIRELAPYSGALLEL
ncbi:MAG: hypothetical protein ACOYI8_00050 [Christensenellales bacterium]